MGGSCIESKFCVVKNYFCHVGLVMWNPLLFLIKVFIVGGGGGTNNTLYNGPSLSKFLYPKPH